MSDSPDLAFLFPGQGAERAGMGLDLAAQSPRARGLIDLAAEHCGVDLWRLLRRGGPEWSRTEVIQPLLVAISLGVLGELRDAGVEARAVAGHSLGELSATCAAGWLEPEAAVALAALRGRLMARQAASHPGGMIALQASDEQAATETVASHEGQGWLVVAGCNAPDQWVLSGSLPAVRSVAAAQSSRRLPAAGAWHSHAMAGAVSELRDRLMASVGTSAQALMVGAATGQVVATPEQVVELLAEQLVQPFRLDLSLGTLWTMGIRRFVTVGPAKVLWGLLRNNLGSDVTIYDADRAVALPRIIEQVRS